MNVFIRFLTFLMLFVSFTWADKLLLEQKILNEIFNGYDSRIRPYGKNGTGATVVEVDTYVRSLSDFDDIKRTYRVQLTFRQKWQDDRLKYDSQGLDFVILTDPYRLWLPDIFFSNELKGNFHNILLPNVLLRIYPDGHVLYSVRISLNLFCPMNLKNYPMDRQTCEIRAASYAYTTSDLVFVWKENNAVQPSRNLILPKFSISGFTPEYCNSRTNTGDYSCIKMSINFDRHITSYLLQIFIPTILLVTLSWIPFWINPRSIVIRLGIWMAMLLAMSIVSMRSVGENVPKVSYITANDVWMSTCVVFIFGVLIEQVVVNNAVTKEDSQRNMDNADKTSIEDVMKNSSRLKNYLSAPLRWLNRYSTKAQKIDAVSRLAFPVAFASFNFVYWLTIKAQ